MELAEEAIVASGFDDHFDDFPEVAVALVELEGFESIAGAGDGAVAEEVFEQGEGGGAAVHGDREEGGFF